MKLLTFKTFNISESTQNTPAIFSPYTGDDMFSYDIKLSDSFSTIDEFKKFMEEVLSTTVDGWSVRISNSEGEIGYEEEEGTYSYHVDSGEFLPVDLIIALNKKALEKNVYFTSVHNREGELGLGLMFNVYPKNKLK